MATDAEIRQRILDNLYGVYPTDSPFVSAITVAYNDSVGSITVLDDTQWDVNDVVENSNTGEQMKVLALAGSDVLTVKRAWNGTTAAASSGSTDIIFKNPRFTRAKVDKAMATALAMLSAWGIHRFVKGTLTRADPVEFYELSATDIVPDYGVLHVYYIKDNALYPVPIPFRYYQELETATSAYAQGRGLYIGDWAGIANGDTAEYIYAANIDAATDLTENQEEIVVLAATITLLGSSVIPATQDPGARTDRTVPPGQTSRDVRYFQGQFFTMVRAEAAQIAVQRQRLINETPKYARARRWRG